MTFKCEASYEATRVCYFPIIMTICQVLIDDLPASGHRSELLNVHNSVSCVSQADIYPALYILYLTYNLWIGYIMLDMLYYVQYICRPSEDLDFIDPKEMVYLWRLYTEGCSLVPGKPI